MKVVKLIFELCFTYYVLKFRTYYTNISELPLYNFAKIVNGELNYLYIRKYKRKAPLAFSGIVQRMVYQFKKLDNKHLRKKADLADFRYKYVVTGNKRWLNEYNTLLAKINKKQYSPFDLDEFTNIIEQTFKHAPGSINAKEISTSKAFSMYYKALKVIKQQQHGNN